MTFPGWGHKQAKTQADVCCQNTCQSRVKSEGAGCVVGQGNHCFPVIKTQQAPQKTAHSIVFSKPMEMTALQPISSAGSDSNTANVHQVYSGSGTAENFMDTGSLALHKDPMQNVLSLSPLYTWETESGRG